MRPIVQISLDLTDIDEALDTAAIAIRLAFLDEEVGVLRGVRKAEQDCPGFSNT